VEWAGSRGCSGRSAEENRPSPLHGLPGVPSEKNLTWVHRNIGVGAYAGSLAEPFQVHCGVLRLLDGARKSLDQPPCRRACRFQLGRRRRAPGHDVVTPMAALVQGTIVGDLAKLLPLLLGDFQRLPGIGLAA
jgi:hypothetical protein